MISAREYLKELIDRGESLGKPQYDKMAIHSALSLMNAYPSETMVRDWMRDVQDFSHKYLKIHPIYQLLVSTFNTMGSNRVTSILFYLEKVYCDYDFWDSIEKQNNLVSEQKKQETTYDVFISHANKDKEEYVEKLKLSFEKLNVKIFYDEDSLEWGDKWKERILDGVSKARFAVIVISENYFGREWTEKELNEFLSRQNASGQKIILPILHNITVEQLREKYPALADIQALDSSKYSCDEIALRFAGIFINKLKR